MIKKYWNTWLFKRFQVKGDTKQLTQRDVLVFFNPEGYLYLILVLITFIAGINYGNNLVLALCFLLSVLLILSFYLAFKQLYGLTVQYEVAELGQIQQPLTVKFNFIPQHQQIHLHLRTEYFNQAKKITVLNSPLVVEFQDVPQQRGLYVLPRLYYYSVYPFGIIKAWSFIYPQKKIWIAPKPLALNLNQFGFSQNQQDQRQGMEDFSHLREFQQGDQLNRVAWQQLAKGRGLLVKQFEEFEQQHQSFDYAQMPAHLHEEKLSQLMFLVEQAHAQQMAFAMVLPSQILPFAQGEQHVFLAKLMLAQEP